jgi:hypothetical protein
MSESELALEHVDVLDSFAHMLGVASARQAEVLRLRSSGCSTIECATVLRVSVSTVERELAGARTLLGGLANAWSTRVQAVPDEPTAASGQNSRSPEAMTLPHTSRPRAILHSRANTD